MDLTIRSPYVSFGRIIDREPALACEASLRNDSERRGKTELHLLIDIAGGYTTPGADASVLAVDVDVVHLSEVGHQPAIEHSVLGGAVTSAIDGDIRHIFATEIHHYDDIHGFG